MAFTIRVKNWLDQVDKMNETDRWSIQAGAPPVINRSLLGLTTSGLRGISGNLTWWSKIWCVTEKTRSCFDAGTEHFLCGADTDHSAWRRSFRFNPMAWNWDDDKAGLNAVGWLSQFILKTSNSCNRRGLKYLCCPFSSKCIVYIVPPLRKGSLMLLKLLPMCISRALIFPLQKSSINGVVQ